MSKIWAYITEWFQRHGGYAHVVASTWLMTCLAYDGVPEFKSDVVTVYGMTPTWVHRVVAVAVPLYVWYKSTRKVSQ